MKLTLGLRKLYPDAIAHAIFLALKYDFVIGLKDEQFKEVVKLDDCIANVLLLEYAKVRGREKLEKAVKRRANELKTADQRDKDKHWLLIYQVWSEVELKGRDQGFLAQLKGKGFQFFALPKHADETEETLEGEATVAEVLATPAEAKDVA